MEQLPNLNYYNEPADYNQLITLNPIKTVNDILIIENKDQFPWGLLHNDYLYENSTSITNLIYESILEEEIKSTENVSQLYSKKLEKIQYNAIIKFYETLLLNPDFKNYFQTLGILKAEDNSILAQMNIQVLSLLQQHYFPNPVNTEVELIEPTDQVGYLFKHNIIIDNQMFEDLVQYIYFSYFLYFLKDQSWAYSEIIKNKTSLEYAFAGIQKYFFEQIIRKECVKYMNIKFSNQNLQNILFYSPNIYIQMRGFLEEYINPISNDVLLEIKKSIIPSESIEIVNVREMLGDSTIKDWVINTRLQDLLYNLHLIFTYLNKPIDTDNLTNFINIFYASCACLLNKNIVYHPPDFFQEWVRKVCSEIHPLLWSKIASVENGGYQNMYIIWIYISSLLKYIQEQKESYKQTIVDCIEKVPSKFSKNRIYNSIYNILLNVQKISLLNLSRFTVGKTEIDLILKLLRLTDCTQSQILEIELFRTIQKDMYEFSKSIPTEFSERIYDIVEFIYKNPISLETKSRVYFYNTI